MIALLIMAAQAGGTPTPAPAAAPQRFSILADPCASANDEQGRDVIVCGSRDAISPRIPLRDFRGVPDHPVPSNPEMSGVVALNGPGVGNECGAYGEDCPVGGGGYLLPKLVDGAVGAVKGAFAKKPDKRGRVAIDLDAPPPAGRLAP